MHNRTIIQRRYACQTKFEELEIRNILAQSILPSSHNIIYMDLAKTVYNGFGCNCQHIMHYSNYRESLSSNLKSTQFKT